MIDSIQAAYRNIYSLYESVTSDAPPLTIGSLTQRFNDALAKHLSFPSGSPERRQSSREARDSIRGLLGDQPNGQPRTLLGQNTKLMKAGYAGKNPLTLPDGSGVETVGLILHPAFEHGKFKLCPNSLSCKESCLGKTSGGYRLYKAPKELYTKRTHALIKNPEAFMIRLHDEIQSAKYVAETNGDKLSVRLNVLSDIHPKAYKALMEAHPDVQFMDYTKLDSAPLVPNHHITYSSTGVSQPARLSGLHSDIHNPHQNWTVVRKHLNSGRNVAMAFSHSSELPKTVHDEETGTTYNVISGDEHDYRPLDGKDSNGNGYIVGLTKKADDVSQQRASEKSHGFFVHYDPKYQSKNGKLIRDAFGKPIVNNTAVTIAKQTRRTFVLNNDSEKVKV